MSTNHDAEPLTLYFDQDSLTKKQMGEAIFIFEQLFGARLRIVDSEIIPPSTDSGSGRPLGELKYPKGGPDSPDLRAQPHAGS